MNNGMKKDGMTREERDAASARRLDDAFRAVAAETEWKLPKSHPARRRHSKQVEVLADNADWYGMDEAQRRKYSPRPAGLSHGSYYDEVEAEFHGRSPSVAVRKMLDKAEKENSGAEDDGHRP